MTDDLDRALSSEPEIRPSPAFLRSVMAEVEREAALPPPIPFPWLRAMPGIAAAVAVVALVMVNAISTVTGADTPQTVLRVSPATMWTLVGLLVSAASMAAAAVRVR
jgi:hypothetical protein